MSRAPRQRTAYKSTARDGFAAISVALRLTHGFAQHFDCDPAFYATLKALQLEADRTERALSKSGMPIDPAIKSAFVREDYDATPGEKLALATHSSILALAAVTADAENSNPA